MMIIFNYGNFFGEEKPRFHRNGGEMTTEINPIEREDQKVNQRPQGGSSGAVYGLGLFGAWAYYFRHVTTIQEGIVAFFKGLFWPAFLVYELLKFLEKD
jgi:hypothetical protein